MAVNVIIELFQYFSGRIHLSVKQRKYPVRMSTLEGKSRNWDVPNTNHYIATLDWCVIDKRVMQDCLQVLTSAADARNRYVACHVSLCVQYLCL